MTAPGVLESHLASLASALLPYRDAAARLVRWGDDLAGWLAGGGRLLVAGNGGSAAEAQHLAAELVGKLRGDRMPLSAIALCAETSSLTAIGNDYGFEEMFARQVRAHGRPGDILLLLSTSGRSANLLAAARAGRDAGLRCWAMTGPAPNPLADICTEVLAVPAQDSQVVQELHLVSVHVLCEQVDLALPGALAGTGRDGSAMPGRWSAMPTGAAPTASPAPTAEVTVDDLTGASGSGLPARGDRGPAQPLPVRTGVDVTFDGAPGPGADA